MNAYELAEQAEGLAYEIPADWSSGEPKNVATDIADMLRQQADRIAELEKELYFKNYYEELPDTPVGIYTKPQIKELSDEEIKPLLDRIQKYLECGGLFNPECMEHDKVRDLIMACKAILKKASEK